jgi:hypothetical protein
VWWFLPLLGVFRRLQGPDPPAANRYGQQCCGDGQPEQDGDHGAFEAEGAVGHPGAAAPSVTPVPPVSLAVP